jgi:myo-inositol-1(or 4)-monophosphatase
LNWLSILDAAELFTDGTTNFIHGFPFVCISLGLIYERRPVLGVIYNPFLNHMVSFCRRICVLNLTNAQYTGIKGQGSFLIPGLDLEPLRLPLASPRSLPSLSQALIGNCDPSYLVVLAYSLKTLGESLGVEWGSDRTLDTINAKAGSFSRLAGNSAQGVMGGKMVHSLRSIGSAALHYGMVAEGGLDLYWYFFFSF